MKLRLICAAGFLTVVVAGLALIAGSGRVTTHPQPTTAQLSKITRARLIRMHVFLTRAPSKVALTAAQADQALEARRTPANRDHILQTVLATCSMTAHPVAYRLRYEDRPCWLILLKPKPVVVVPPMGSDQPETTITPTIRFALVDANTGVVCSQADGYTARHPANRPQTQPAAAGSSF